jgi:hypothetical protein
MLYNAAMWTDRQAIEVFHLLFLRSFGARVDKTLFALKGGCNLRFYHRSIRYSEDMDLDVRTMAQGTLRSNVEAVLDADPFRHSDHPWRKNDPGASGEGHAGGNRGAHLVCRSH